MKIGNYKVTSLVTSRFSLDGGSIFGIIPKSMWGKEVVSDKKNRIPLVTRSLLIRGNGKTILVDTGNGDKWDSKMKAILDTDPSLVNIQASLGELSVKPDEITDVICSHLHFDHAGGNTILDGGKVVPTFPNAKYWLQKSNWDWAKNYITIWVLLSSRPSPVIYQVEIGKVVENDPNNMAMGSQFSLKLVAGFFFHPFSDKS